MSDSSANKKQEQIEKLLKKSADKKEALKSFIEKVNTKNQKNKIGKS